MTILVLTWGCRRAAERVPEAATCDSPACEVDITLSGWFHIVWNGSARYYLVRENAQATDLIIEEETAQLYGGRAALDRRHVTLSGVRLSPTLIRVRSIHLERSP